MDAQNAVASLQAEGILAQFAKLPQVHGAWGVAWVCMGGSMGVHGG